MDGRSAALLLQAPGRRLSPCHLSPSFSSRLPSVLPLFRRCLIRLVLGGRRRPARRSREADAEMVNLSSGPPLGLGREAATEISFTNPFHPLRLYFLSHSGACIGLRYLSLRSEKNKITKGERCDVRAMDADAGPERYG